jgi:hypothetical protein
MKPEARPIVHEMCHIVFGFEDKAQGLHNIETLFADTAVRNPDRYAVYAEESFKPGTTGAGDRFS